MPKKTGRRQAEAGKRKNQPGSENTARRKNSRGPHVRSSNYQGPRSREPGYGQAEGVQRLSTGILQKYLEPDKDRERELQQKKKEIMASKARKEKNRREVKEAAAGRVSYVRKPFARRSKMSIILTAAALLLGGGGIYVATATQGQATLTHGAMGFCSIFLSAVAIWYGGISFLEDDKNYILAKLGIGISILMLAAWAFIIFIGLGGLG